MQRALIVVLVLISAALTWWALNLQGRLATAEGALFSLRNEHDVAQKVAAVAKAETEPLRANIARLTEERDRAKAMAKVTLPAEAARPVEPEPNLLGGLLQSMDSPVMRKMMRGQAVAEARKDYATLVKKWRLSPKDADQFVQFITDRDFDDTEDAMAFLKDGTIDEKQMAEMEKKEAERVKESATRLKALLGEQRLAELEKFDAEKEHLLSVARYGDQLTAAGFPLDAKQQEELGNILRTAAAADGEKTPSQRKLEEAAAFAVGFTEESIAAERKKDEAVQRQIITRAAGLLNPDQISALQSAFNDENDEKEMGLKFAGQIMKSGALKEAPGGKAEVKTQVIIHPKLGK